MRRDQVFKKDIQLNSQRVRILRRPQTTDVAPPVLETQEVSNKPAGLGPI